MRGRTLLFLIVAGMANAATYIERLQKKPQQFSNQEGCYLERIQAVVPFGESVSLNPECVRAECQRSHIEYSTCSVVATENPKCYIEKRNNVDYPHCCPWITCE